MNSLPAKRQIALDLGTTTLTGRLLSLAGEPLAEVQSVNPQREMGADILSRLQRAEAGEGQRLQALLVSGLRRLVADLLAAANCPPEDVTTVVAAGNPGISCLLRNLPVAPLLLPPHKAPFTGMTRISTESLELGLAVPLQLFPLVSGFVGGDLVACLLALEDVQPGTVLVDIGTNAELALWDGSRWWVTSAAAGPAFEGGNIGTGMIMTDGAVVDVCLENDRLRLQVAGGGPPRGLCGSGLVALVAAARQAGLIDATGRIRAADEIETNLDRYLVAKNDSRAIRFHHSAAAELQLSQEDLRNLQLAKGAVHAGVMVLLERGGFTAEAVPRVLLTGALGTALGKDVLKRVALLPEAMLDKTRFVKNGVLSGLQSYLSAEDGRQRLESLLANMQPFPLSGTPAFEKLFLASLNF